MDRLFAGCAKAGHGAREEQHRGDRVRPEPANVIAKDENEAGAQHTDAIEAYSHAVGETHFVAIKHLDCVTVNGDIIGRGQQGENAYGKPHARAKAGSLCKYDQGRTHQAIDRHHPITMMAVVVDRRRPEKFHRPGQAQKAEQSNAAQINALLAKIYREQVEKKTQREALGEIKKSHPEKLGAQQTRLFAR